MKKQHDEFLASERKKEARRKPARPDKASSTARAGCPLRSLEEFAQLLMKHRLMDECAWFDPEGYDGGATVERLSRAFHEATDNGEHSNTPEPRP